MSLSFCHSYSLLVPAGTPPAGGYDLTGFCLLQLRSLVMLYCAGICAEARLREAVVSSLEIKQTKAAIEVLLSSLCDSIVTLNEDLRIMGPTTKLSALLLSALIPEGSSFVDLMPNEDAEAFCQHMRVEGRKDHALSLNVRLRTSGGAAVPVRLYHIPFSGLMDAKAKHLVGVVEMDTTGIKEVIECFDDDPASLVVEAPYIGVPTSSSSSSRAGHADSMVTAVEAPPVYIKPPIAKLNASVLELLSARHAQPAGHRTHWHVVFEPDDNESRSSSTSSTRSTEASC